MAGVTNPDIRIGDYGNNAELVVKSDTTDFTGPVSIVCYDGSVVRIKTAAGQVIDHPVIPGMPLPVLVLRVYTTTTNATKIVAYW